MHPSLRGQIALAQAILQALRGQGAFGWPAGTPVPQIAPSDCVEHFALIPEVWRRVALWGVMFYDLTASLRYDPSSRELRSAAFSRAAARIEAGEPPESLGLPNIGLPEAVPLVPGAAAVPQFSVAEPEPLGESSPSNPISNLDHR